MERQRARLKQILKGGRLPKLAVFDLDYTIWAFWNDCTAGPPYRKESDLTIVDRSGEVLHMYPESRMILEEFRNENIKVGFASRSPVPKWTRNVVETFGLLPLVDNLCEIYPGSKEPHFKSLHKKTGIPFDEMIFFDDEMRNLVDVSKLGVTCQYCPRGLSVDEVEKCLEAYRKKKKPL
ncbi:hypothetical protein GAYE_SCF27MG4691 [Galdieria yellowstonensis]|jgi:magnesium-dependent phosphatase 1|uniref:Magnesium-dependent phosphatase 1 n=1 Tax=Galdieria yellowstonensis TaxID=3028027 RepID=A0AAV9IHJ0_9RHOD|nr:hypothetical protein GAYE_SCF27MG4691 [Galdieria yellowstonensis]